MSLKNTLIALLILSTNLAALGQQDPLFSQYLFNQSMINPAYTGVNDVMNASLFSRRQWVGLEGAPQTNTLNASASIINNKVGVGLLISRDTYGVNKNTEYQAMYSYKIDLLNGKSLSFGLQTGYIDYRYDYSKLLLEQTDQALELVDAEIAKVNFGSGIYFKTNQFYLGASVPRMLNMETQSINGTSTVHKRHFYVSAGYVFDQLIALKFKPSVLIKVVEGQPISIDLNASFLLLETLWVGATIRNFNAVGINSQFEINDMFRLGYSFEYPLNTVGTNTFGTHEIMFSVDLEVFKNNAIGRRYF